MRISYEAMRAIVIASLIVYFIAGLHERFIRHGGETYPFFSWYLFAAIPNYQEQAFTIRILSLGDTVYDPPLVFSQTGPIFKRLRQSPTEYTPIINTLGWSIVHKRGNTAEIRQRLEQMFGGLRARYELLMVAYDPVDFWKSGTVASSTVLGVYDTDRP